MNKLLTVGSMAFDTIETPLGKIEKTIGGSVNYISVAASFFDIEQAIVSVVGKDYPAQYLQCLSERKIDLSQVQIAEGETLFWSGKYHNDMNTRNTLETRLNVLADFKPIVPEAYKTTDVLMLGNLHPQTQLDVLSQLRKRPKLVALDTMDYWINNALTSLWEIISKVDVIIVNDQEARALTGEFSPMKAAQILLQKGVKFVVIKKGEHGAMLFHQNEVFLAPALPLEEVCDPTGAGDTFAGGFLGYLTQCSEISFEKMKQALVYGSVLASFCVQEFGIKKLLTLSKSQIQERKNTFKKLTHFEDF